MKLTWSSTHFPPAVASLILAAPVRSFRNILQFNDMNQIDVRKFSHNNLLTLSAKSDLLNSAAQNMG